MQNPVRDGLPYPFDARRECPDGVKLDGEAVSDLRMELELSVEERVLQVGKRKFARLVRRMTH